MLKRLFTKNLTRIPILWIHFNYKHYKKEETKNSFRCCIHPLLAKDEHIKNVMNGLVDYIRSNYDMNEM